MIPPSVHPSGELLEWADPFGDPARWAADPCYQQPRNMATAVLLGRHWPTGSRHDAALAVGGFLASRQVPLDQALRVIEDIVGIAKDDELDDRMRAVRESYDSFKANDKTTGLPQDPRADRGRGGRASRPMVQGRCRRRRAN